MRLDPAITHCVTGRLAPYRRMRIPTRTVTDIAFAV